MKATWKTIFAVLLSVVLAIGSGCKKETLENPGNNNGGGGNTTNDVRVTTYAPQDVTATTAVCGGDVIVTDGLSLTEIGVCWSTTNNPMPDGAHLSTSNWNEPFVCTLTGLEPNKRYYVRAYALRGLEYYYGAQRSFTTLSGGGGGGNLPLISVYHGDGYIQNGDVLDIDIEYSFGFNVSSASGLASLEIDVDGNEFDFLDLWGMTSYTYTNDIMYSLDRVKDEIVGESVINAVVTDSEGRTNHASIRVSINQPAQPLEQVSFEWVRQGPNSLNEDEMAGYGLYWSANYKDVFATIKPLEGAILYVCNGDDFDYITTDIEKAAFFANLAENGIPVESYRNVSCNMNANYNDMLVVKDPDAGMHLIHVMYGQVEFTAAGTRVSISGELK